MKKESQFTNEPMEINPDRSLKIILYSILIGIVIMVISICIFY
jgi:transposase